MSSMLELTLLAKFVNTIVMSFVYSYEETLGFLMN
jgi:hypothetical protein